MYAAHPGISNPFRLALPDKLSLCLRNITQKLKNDVCY